MLPLLLKIKISFIKIENHYYLLYIIIKHGTIGHYNISIFYIVIHYNVPSKCKLKSINILF